MHAFDWPEHACVQTLKIYMQYFTYFACNNDLCNQSLVQCCAYKPTWGHIPQLFATFETS